MPLRALDDADRSVDASLLTAPEWAALTATNRQVRQLRTLCCGSPVALKTSRLGTRFFAHLALGGCASGDETPEHLHLKALAIAAARAHGWNAAAEVAGVTPDCRPWRADVLATRGRSSVAVEVQWSPQADDVTRSRQARYAASGVRGLWLFRSAGNPVAADVPAVRVRGSLRAGLTIAGLPAGDFLAAVFDRRLRFGFPGGSTATLTVHGGVATCWGSDCRALTRGVTGLDLVAAGSRCTVAVAALGRHRDLLAEVAASLPADPLRGQLRARRDGTAVAGCFACDRPLGDWPARGRFIVASVPLVVTAAWATMLAAQPGYRPAWSVVAPVPASA